MKKISAKVSSGLLVFLLIIYSLQTGAELSIDNPDFISPMTDIAKPDQLVKLTDADQQAVREQVLESGNLLEVTVRQDAKINKIVRVDAAGNIELHLLGQIMAAGRSVKDLEKNIAQKLAQDYIHNPVVAVKLLEYKSFSFAVSGAIGRSGQYKLFPGMTLLDAIPMAGNFTAQSDPSNVRVIRLNKQTGVSSDIQLNVDQILSGKLQDFTLENGDQIIVGELPPIYLRGAVMYPGPIYTPNQILLRDALAGVGGVGNMADINRIQVFDTPSNKAAEAKIYDLELVVEGKVKEPLINPGSLIVVEECASKYSFFGKIICKRY